MQPSNTCAPTLRSSRQPPASRCLRLTSNVRPHKDRLQFMVGSVFVVNAAQPSVTAFRLRLAAAAYPLASGTSSTHCNAGQRACTVGAGGSSLGGHRRSAADRKQGCSALGQTFVCSPKQMGERPICHRPVVGTAQPPTATRGAVYSPGGSGQHPHSPGFRFNSRRSVRRRSIASARLLSSCHAL